MKTLFAATILVAMMASIQSADAWWDMGHMQIAARAYEQVTPAVRARVDVLIKLNVDYYPKWTIGVAVPDQAEAAFVHAATWADDIKHNPTYTPDKVTDATATRNVGYTDHIVHDYWHYIDIPFSRDGTPVAPPPLPNALTEIELMTQALGSNATDDIKSYDLVWLLHLVGDVHQPLHATSRFTKTVGDDHGGNGEQVTTVAGQTVKLHLYWDGLLGDQGTASDAIAAAKALPIAEPVEADINDPAIWIVESFAIAQNDVYASEIGPDAGPYPLTQAYEDNAHKVAQQRAAIAGARLAGRINSALK